MDRRTVKNFIMKRSSIWTMSLCLTGALTFGGIAWLDHAIRGEEKTQIKNEEEQELNKFADISDDSEYIAGMDLNFEEYNTTAASGTAIDEANDTNMVNGKLMLEEHSDMDEIQEGMTENPVDENMNESSYNDEMLIDEQGNSVSSVSATGDTAISEQILMDAGISFSDAETLLWPSAGTILIDYSMDSSVYFSTLNQYKYNPALIIGSAVGNQVLASAAGIVESVFIDEETGTTLVMNIGNGYKLTYGQLKELTVEEGDIVESGTVLGYISEPTKYFVEEGSNLYFEMTYEGNAVDPVLYLEG